VSVVLGNEGRIKLPDVSSIVFEPHALKSREKESKLERKKKYLIYVLL